MSTTNLHKTALVMMLLLLGFAAAGQVRISGTIYDRTARFRMAGVSVMSNSGAGTVTDSAGNYHIKLPPDDSISFSYQGKATMKFAVKEIPTNRPFDMSLHVNIQMLPTVEVTTKRHTYQLDSLERRNEYRKVFDFAPEYLTTGGGGGVGAGINLDALFSIRKIKRMEAFRRYLEQEERDKYVDYRFNKVLVGKITGLQSPALDTFMKQYRPSYELILSFETEYQYYLYIQECGKAFSAGEKRYHPI